MKRNISHTRFICRYTKRIFFLFSLLIATNMTLGQISISKTVVPKSVCNQFDVTLSITGTPPEKPIDVILVIDNSGSMSNGSPSSMYYAKQAALEFMRKIYSAANGAQNRVGIVSYSDYGVEEIQLTYRTDSTLVKNEINALVATNYTNIADGFYQAAKEMKSRGRTDCDVLHSIVLLTDGVANRGSTYNSSGDRYQGSCSPDYPTSASACTNMAITQGQAAWTFVVGSTTYNTKVTTVGLFGGLNSYPASKTLAQSVLNSAQNAGFYQTDAAADLNGIYNQIFLQLIWAARAIPGVPMVSDTITTGFTYLPGTLVASKGTATVNGQIITWPLDFVNNETVTLTYSVEADIQVACGIQNSSKSWMTYEDVTCTHRAVMFTPPSICVPCPRITPITLVQQNCSKTINYQGTLIDAGTACHTNPSYSWTFMIDSVEIGTAQGLSGTFIIPDQYYTESCDKKLKATLSYVSGGGCSMYLGESQEITLHMVTSVPSVPADGAATVQCISAAIEPTPPVINDICGTPLSHQLSIVDLPAPLTCEGTRTYSYVYTNCAGLSATWKYVYTIDYTTAPTEVGGPVANASSISCIASATAPSVLPVVKDVCGNILTPGTPAIGGTYANCEGTRTYAYTYTDCSGLTFTWTYTYTIDDNIAPTGTAPADISGLQCIEDVPSADILLIQDEADNCNGSVVVTVSEVNNDGSGCINSPYIVTRTYTLTDCAGNKTDLVQTITVIDNTPPSIICPSVPVSVWPNSGPNYIQSGSSWDATATDNCSAPTVLFTLSGATNSPNNLPTLNGVTFNYGTTLVTWTATDACGNSSSCSYSIVVLDNTPPLISCPQTITVSCSENIPVVYATLVQFIAAGGSVSDNTGIDTLSFKLLSENSDGLKCPESITRVYQIADIIGNTATCSQLIIVNDTIAPVIEALPEPSTISCPAIPVFVQANASDNCESAFNLTFNDVKTDGQCTGNYSVTRTWTATDACGNSSQASQTINVQDISAPVIAALPAPSLISCPAIPEFVQATASDECGSAFTLTYVDVTTNGACAGSYSVNRYWTATDDCGNSSYAFQTINVQDITAPVIAALPPPRSISCPAEPVFAQATASDECGSAFTLTYEDVKTRGDCAGSYSVTRTWTATDACGNSSSSSQTINVQDISAPVISALPGPSTIYCPAEPAFNRASATDDCGSDFVLTYHDVRTDGQCVGSYSMTRTWTATDACGNSSSASQIINVQDISAPVIAALPAPSTIYCPAVPVFAQATAIDECFSAFTLTFADITTAGACAGNYSVTRTWTATDACGNSSYASQTINVQDISAPVIAALPAPSIIDCPAVPVFAQATASDDCGSELVLNFHDVTVNGICAGNYSVTRIWTARDACGNISHASQTINVQDITAPVITCPVNITSNNDLGMNGANVIVPQPGYFEACGSVILSNSFNLTDNASGFYPVGITSVVWTATDECGNSSSCTMTITVIDNESPVITCPPDIVHCSPDITLGQPVVSDNSGIASITNDAPLVFPIGVTTIVTWTITDIHGNVTLCTQAVTISNLIVSAEGSSQVSCNNASDGSVTASASGGTGWYEYSLDGIIFGPSNQFNDLPAGSYTVTVKDSLGCIAITNAVVIANPDLLIASATGSSQVSCHNSSDGIITVIASGGTGDYSYSLNGGNFGSSNEFIGLLAGSYFVTVMDENECTAVTEALVIANPDLLTASATGSSQVSCYNSSDGSLIVDATGGTGSLSYSLNGGTFGPDSEFAGLPAGTYIVTVIDENKCTAVTEPFVIENPADITIAVVSSQQVNCNNDSDGVIIAVAHGGTGNFVYALNGGAYQQSNVFSNLPAGSYSVAVMDENGCTAVSAVIIIENPALVSVEAFIISGNLCFGEADATIDVYANGGTSPYVYSLDGSEPSVNSQYSNITAGYHGIVVYDINGCKGIGKINIEAQAELLISVVSSSDADCMGKSDGSLEVTGVGGVPPYTYQWSTGVFGSQISGLDAGEYIVTATDANGCITISPETVKAGASHENIIVNTAFSPNGDGINDLWTIHNLEKYPDNELTVINRWGNEVYTQKGYKNSWDGSDLTEGTYFYILKCKICGESREFKGYITIVR
jgi:gliding motility-associated-like protein